MNCLIKYLFLVALILCEAQINYAQPPISIQEIESLNTDINSKFDTVFFLGKGYKYINLIETHHNEQAIKVGLEDSLGNHTILVFNNKNKTLKKVSKLNEGEIYPKSKIVDLKLNLHQILSDEYLILTSDFSVALYNRITNTIISEIPGLNWNDVDFSLTKDGLISSVFDNKLVLFDKDLRYLETRNIHLPPKRSKVLAHYIDSVYYTLRENDKIYLFEYNHQFKRLDTLTVMITDPPIFTFNGPFGWPDEYLIRNKWFFWTFDKSLQAFQLNSYDLETKESIILFSSTSLNTSANKDKGHHKNWAILDDGKYLAIQTFHYKTLDDSSVLVDDVIDFFEIKTGDKIWSKKANPSSPYDKHYDLKPYFNIWQGILVATHIEFKKQCGPCDSLNPEQAHEVTSLYVNGTGRVLLKYTTELDDDYTPRNAFEQYKFNEHRVIPSLNAKGEAYLFIK